MKTGFVLYSVSGEERQHYEFEAAHPEVKLSKDERDGMFYEVGDAVLSVYPTETHFSTGKAAGA